MINIYKKYDTLPSGKIADRVYLQVKHKYCKNIFIVRPDFFKMKSRCTRCCGSYEKSFAYHIEKELGLNINDVWDFEKNTVDPYMIWKSSNKKVWVKCQNEEVNEVNGMRKKDYHGSYQIQCNSFISGVRCGYCNVKGKKYNAHKYDSFGYKYPKFLEYWSKNNDKSPYNVSCGTQNKYIFICEKCGSTFSRSIKNQIKSRSCLCLDCHMSEGEFKIKKFLKENKINFIHDKACFKNLVGAGGHLLRPDFILPDYKIWIEYDGEFHYKDVVESQTEEEFKKLKLHDGIKNKYADKYGWKMIRIPYTKKQDIINILKNHLN